jgi:hypothetical protein
MMSIALLWLFVINLGIAFGAGLYEHRIVVSRWITAGPHFRHALVLAAWLAALQAFALVYQYGR